MPDPGWLANWSDNLPWSVAVRTGETWTRYPAPDLRTAIRVRREYSAAGYTAAVQSCKCGTQCRCERHDPLPTY